MPSNIGISFFIDGFSVVARALLYCFAGRKVAGRSRRSRMNFKTAVVQLVTVSLLIFANSFFATAQLDSIYRLPAGTRIRLKMDVELSSRVAAVNDTFAAKVAKPVMVRDVVVLPVGTVIEGRVDSVSMAAAGGHNGELDPVFESIRFENAQPRKIQGELVDKLVGPSSSMTNVLSVVGGTVIGAVLGAVSKTNNGALIGAGVGAGAGTSVALLRKGKDVRIRTGEEFEIELKREVLLPVLDY